MGFFDVVIQNFPLTTWLQTWLFCTRISPSFGLFCKAIFHENSLNRRRWQPPTSLTTLQDQPANIAPTSSKNNCMVFSKI
jgi:hypothetical protein